MIRLRIPPHVGWPLLVVVLLLVGISGAFAALFAARSDGGARIVDDYYQKAARWEESARDRAASDALGWQVRLAIVDSAAVAPLRFVEITVSDAAGAPVTGLRGTVRALRPQSVRAVAEVPLAPVPGRPGRYRQLLPLGSAGLWDFEIRAERGAERFGRTVRAEIR